MNDVLIEACVDSVRSAIAAERGGARRLELCDDLVEGGTTPSVGMLAQVCARVRVPVYVLVRPRGGDFLYDDDEVEVMRRDVVAAREAGARGVVIGALTPDGALDEPVLRALLDAAGPLGATLHRAFDVARSLDEALDAAIGLGFERVLTSGGASTAIEGGATLARLVARAAGRIAVMAGGRVDAAAAPRLTALGLRELHVRGAERVESAMRFRREGIAFGKRYEPDEYGRPETSAERIAAIVSAAQGPVS